MSRPFTGNVKACATCTYWLGERTFNNCYQRIVIVKSAMEKGACANSNSPNYWTGRNSGLQANWCCRCYKRRTAIKI